MVGFTCTSVSWITKGLKEFRAGHSKICNLDIKTVLRWKQMRKKQTQDRLFTRKERIIVDSYVSPEMAPNTVTQQTSLKHPYF